MAIDFDFRPPHPFRLQSLTREAVRRGEESGSRRQRRQMEAVHPAFMGGNYLPPLQDGEIEVARLQLESVTADVCCAVVRQAGRDLCYRLIDEYDGETLAEPTELTVRQPLSLRELARFMGDGSNLREVLDMNFEGDRRGRFRFFHASSADYPHLQAAVTALVQDWCDDDDF